MAHRSRAARGRPGGSGRAFLLGLLGLFVAASTGAYGLSVSIVSPTDGVWTASPTVSVNGTALGPGPDSHFLNSDADFAGGLQTNTTVSSGTVRQAFPTVETYRYEQAFTGLGGANSVDPHWTWDFNATTWEISNLASLSNTPPSLAHSGTGTHSHSWMAALPGNATEGWVAFRYMCEANGVLNVFSSTTGHGASEANILTTTQSAPTDFFWNLSSQALGADMFVVRFEASSFSPTSSYCSIDDFVAEFNFTRATSHTLRLADNFDNDESNLWNVPQGAWDATSALGPDPPAYGHTGMAPTDARLNLAFPSAITRATVAFRYQCDANATFTALLSAPGVSETPMVTGLAGSPFTNFQFDGTATVGGTTSLYVRLVGSAVAATGDLCIIDDLAINVTYRGHMGLLFQGEYLSPIVDLGIAADLSGCGWWGGAGVNTTLDVYARSSLNNLTYTAWTPVAGGGSAPPAALGRYIQYRADFTSAGGFQTAALDALVVNFSAIVSVEWTTNQVTWFLASGTTNWTANVPLGNGANTISVRARDTTGAIVTSQVQVSRDNIPPGPAGKPQAVAVTNQTSVAWNWTPASDVGVGVSHYLVDVGLSAGGTELATGIQVTGTNYTHSSIPDGVTVYLSVRSVDGGGLPGLDRVSSNGTVVDRGSPDAPRVQGPGQYSNRDSLTWTWTKPSDAGTGVASYRVRVGTSAGAGDLFTGDVSATTYTFSPTVSGTTYFATVFAVDGAGNEGPSATSTGTTSDRDAPTAPTSVTTPATLTNQSSITWQWTAAVDAISGVDHYLVEVGSAYGLGDLASLTVTERTYTLGYVESGTFVYFAVTPVDTSGNVGARVEAPAVHSDTTAPLNTSIARVNPYVANATVDIEWMEVIDLPAAGGSGIAHYVVRVRHGTTVTETTVTGTQHTLEVTDGVTYTVEVFAVDDAMNEGPLVSVTFTSDRSGPAAPATVTSRVSNPDGPSFTASWNATVDTGVGLSEYRVSVGTTPGGTDIASTVRVTRLNYTWTGEDGTQYWVSVYAVDKLGNRGVATQTTQPISYTPAETGGGFLPGFESVFVLLALAAAGLFSLGRRASMRPVRRRRRGMP